MHKLYTNTKLLGKNLVFLPKCHSTNDTASELLRQNQCAEGTIVYTQHQTNGRGQRGNKWQAAPDQNLTFSAIFKPQFLDIAHNFYLNIFVSLAIHDYLQASIVDKHHVKIKWPNDIYYQNLKICGILIENFLKGPYIKDSIVGIGLNVNQSNFHIPNATSLSQISQRTYALEEELISLLYFLEKRYEQLKEFDLEGLKQDYYQSMYWINELHTFQVEGNPLKGYIRGVEDNGRLQIETNQIIRSFDLKEVIFVR